MSNIKLDAAKAARYWGCEVIGKDDLNTEIEPVIGKMVELSDHKLTISTDKEYCEFMPFECQLLLTPLSAITDEHAIEVAKVARPEITDYNHLLNIGWGIISVIKDGYIIPELGFKSITAILRKLCEFGYDCDNAIEEGWAVDKTTFKQ